MAGKEKELTPGELATERVVRLAHDGTFVRRFIEGTLDTKEVRTIGFPWSAELVARTRATPRRNKL